MTGLPLGHGRLSGLKRELINLASATSRARNRQALNWVQEEIICPDCSGESHQVDSP
jgi:hypothetical protein